MEYITGHRPDNLEYLDSHSISREDVAAALSRIFNTMIFAKGAPLHCDPHGGNIAIRSRKSHTSRHNFEVILYDHGLYRTIPIDLQRNYAKLWLAVLEADEHNMRKYAFEIAGITDEQFPLFASAITGRDYRVVASDVSGTPRSDDEKQAISDALGEGMLQELIHLLGRLPRIILLILKTNDLSKCSARAAAMISLANLDYKLDRSTQTCKHGKARYDHFSFWHAMRHRRYLMSS